MVVDVHLHVIPVSPNVRTRQRQGRQAVAEKGKDTPRVCLGVGQGGCRLSTLTSSRYPSKTKSCFRKQKAFGKGVRENTHVTVMKVGPLFATTCGSDRRSPQSKWKRRGSQAQETRYATKRRSLRSSIRGTKQRPPKSSLAIILSRCRPCPPRKGRGRNDLVEYGRTDRCTPQGKQIMKITYERLRTACPWDIRHCKEHSPKREEQVHGVRLAKRSPTLRRRSRRFLARRFLFASARR